jgi:hypothetical protein
MGRKIACLLGGPDEDDARLCIAYDGDELAPCDVRSMRDALGRHGFETSVVPRRLKRRGEVYDHVAELAGNCSSQDEFLFYFSGHGNFRQGKLELALGEQQSLPAHDLLRIMEDCRAITKLAILDCCYAGAIEKLGWPEQRNDLRLLLAATDEQRALHDPIHGSFFSRFLCEVLTDCSLWLPGGPQGLTDTQGNLSSYGLVEWLRERMRRAAEERAWQPSRIPRPLALPRDGHGFRVLRLNLDQPLGYPDHLRDDLRRAMTESAITADAAAASYAWCAAQQDGSALPESAAVPSTRDILDTLLSPACFYLAGDALKLPLIGFAAHLSQGRAADDPLDRWLRTALAWLYDRSRLPIDHINDAQRVDHATPATTAQPHRPPCLLIEVAPANPPLRGYQVAWDSIDDKGDTRRKADRGAAVEHAELPAAIAAILPDALGASRGARIELVLPAALLADDDLLDRLERLGCWAGVLHGAQGPLADGHLAHERPFVLRCWERWGSTALDAERFGGWRLREHWRERAACLHQAPPKHCLDWIDATAGADLASPAKRLLHAPRLDQRPLALGLGAPIPPDQLEPLLRTGAPILLWPRRVGLAAGDAVALQDDLRERCADHGLAALPRALHDRRRHRAGGADALSLLWDTPDLLKYDQPPDDPDLMFEAPP